VPQALMKMTAPRARPTRVRTLFMALIMVALT
jgi:hypothetical protein